MWGWGIPDLAGRSSQRSSNIMWKASGFRWRTGEGGSYLRRSCWLLHCFSGQSFRHILQNVWGFVSGTSYGVVLCRGRSRNCLRARMRGRGWGVMRYFGHKLSHNHPFPSSNPLKKTQKSRHYTTLCGTILHDFVWKYATARGHLGGAGDSAVQSHRLDGVRGRGDTHTQREESTRECCYPFVTYPLKGAWFLLNLHKLESMVKIHCLTWKRDGAPKFRKGKRHIPSDTKLLHTKIALKYLFLQKLRISPVIPWKYLPFLEILRAQHPSKITKNNSQGIHFAIISCQKIKKKLSGDCLGEVGGVLPTGWPWCQMFMCCVRNPRNINIFVRVLGREDWWPGWPRNRLCAKCLCALCGP